MPPPPLAMFAMEHGSSKRLLFDISTGKVRGVRSSVFAGATCAFESGGWLLMVRQSDHNALGGAQEEQTVFLVHPASGARLDLPSLRAPGRGLFVLCVSPSRGGAPLVVARVEAVSLVPTVHVACPGDPYWTVCAAADPPPTAPGKAPPEPTWVVDVALFGTRAVCLDLNGEVLVFDVEMAWTRSGAPAPAFTPPPGLSAQDARSLVASADDDGGGVVVLVSRPRAAGGASSGFRFFRLDVAALEWSPLDGRELDGTSWFLRQGQSFRVREPGSGRRRVYTFGGPEQGGGAPPEPGTAKAITNVYAYDLDDGSVEMVIPASIVTEAQHWVRPSVFATPAK